MKTKKELDRKSEKKSTLINLEDTSYYENRELSWLEFNQRVLEEAENSDNPLFERLKFMAITSSNLDEFFMVRVASLKEQVNAGYDRSDYSGLTPKKQLKCISDRTHRLVDEQARHYKRQIIPALRREGIILRQSIKDLSDEQFAFVDHYFNHVLYPVLTPLAVDSSRPFPLILNKTLNIAVLLKTGENYYFATVQVPSIMPRLIEIPATSEQQKEFIYLEAIISRYISTLFIGYTVELVGTYRITRNGDLSIDEEEAEDLLLEIEKSIRQRKWGETIRLEVDKKMDKRLLEWLVESLGIHQKDTYLIDGPIDLTFLMKLYSLEGTNHLKYPPYQPQWPVDLLGQEDVFSAIREKDIFLHHPFESFEPVIDFIKRSAIDQRVMAIKQTLYRVSGDSPIIQALSQAAEVGKQVTVLVELKARFDEENNIQWARRLEKAGCHVIYGLVGLKTHSKITLVVRQEEDGIRRYVHLGTGNYNDITAKLYTDMGLLTCSEKIGADASAVFNTLSGYSEPPEFHKITMAPIGLRDRFNFLIRREAVNAQQGKPAKIICKMNSLCDADIIKELYQASMAGVEIELLVRGICGLVPGIEGVSHNITVKSIVGKYLEHSRIYYFCNNGQPQVYLSSADFMPRNLNRRVELLFPIEEEAIKERLFGILAILSKDVVKAKYKTVDRCYKHIDRRGKEIVNAQDYFEKQASEWVAAYEQESQRDAFIPVMGQGDELI